MSLPIISIIVGKAFLSWNYKFQLGKIYNPKIKEMYENNIAEFNCKLLHFIVNKDLTIISGIGMYLYY